MFRAYGSLPPSESAPAVTAAVIPPYFRGMSQQQSALDKMWSNSPIGTTPSPDFNQSQAQMPNNFNFVNNIYKNSHNNNSNHNNNNINSNMNTLKGKFTNLYHMSHNLTVLYAKSIIIAAS